MEFRDGLLLSEACAMDQHEACDDPDLPGCQCACHDDDPVCEVHAKEEG